jgi:hypothetical protein
VQDFPSLPLPHTPRKPCPTHTHNLIPAISATDVATPRLYHPDSDSSVYIFCLPSPSHHIREGDRVEKEIGLVLPLHKIQLETEKEE